MASLQAYEIVAEINEELGYGYALPNGDIIDQLAEDIWSQRPRFRLVLANDTILTYDVEWERIWADGQQVKRTAGSPRRPSVAESAPPNDDEYLMVDSLKPEFWLDEDYEGVIPLHFNELAVGHPFRPLLVVAFAAQAEDAGDLIAEDWPLYTYPSKYLIWYEDSPHEEFNDAAWKALQKIGAKESGSIEFGGKERLVFELPKPFESGLLPKDGKIIDAFLKEESKIDEFLNEVPTLQEVKAAVRQVELPEELIVMADVEEQGRQRRTLKEQASKKGKAE